MDEGRVGWLATLKVKPCPFCGKAPTVGPIDPVTSGSAWGFVRCRNSRCAAEPQVECYRGSDSVGSRSYIRGAVRSWNRRRG